MYDFHTHILPRLDHGSDGAETTKKQLSLLKKLSVTHAVATSHFYPDVENLSAFLDRRRASVETLRSCLTSASPTIYLGCEVLITEGIDHLQGIENLCIEGTNILLLEMPFYRWNDGLKRTVKKLCRSGLRVMLAHIERYPARAVQELFDMGVMGQVNCSAFHSIFAFRTYKKQIEAGLIQALGTDLHMPNEFSRASVSRAERKIGKELWAKLEKNGQALLAEAVPLSSSETKEKL